MIGPMRKVLFLWLLVAWALPAAAEKLPVVKPPRIEKDLYGAFREPAARYRPFVRWWWNGSRVTPAEILRELDSMRAAGIGGVEINTIQFPDMTSDTVGCAALEWLSPAWIDAVRTAADGCRERGMTCDVIVGSGWPFGAEYLRPDQQVQQLYPVTIDVRGGRFEIDRQQVLDLAHAPIMSFREPEKELLYIRLMPKQVAEFTPGVSYDCLAANETIAIDVPEGEWVLYFFVRRTGYMRVILGAPGASGPVVNHLDAKAVRSYLDNFSDAMRFAQGELKGKIRAAFCDSFELEGDNWTTDMLAEFERRRGYSLVPYLPYVIRKTAAMGEPIREAYGCEFAPEVEADIVHRVRNDYEHVQIELFAENFLDTYNKWCRRNGLLSRVQAYGHQLHPIEASMRIDIPECESWIHDGIGRVMNPGEYLSGRGYSMVNKYVASGSFLSGRRIVSCEEQTNVGNIFQTTLEEIKATGDRSNLSGVNHSVLHGYNYSPPQDDFLGWIQFGTYFHENNPWWPYLRRWTDYKARISAVLQNSDFQADIAVLQPLEDLWSIHGQQRDPYPAITYPAYANEVWEAIQQAGNGCDLVSEGIVRQADVRRGELRFGPRAYKTLLLVEVESMAPETAERIARFVEGGGRVIAVGKVPHRSLGLKDAARNDARVEEAVGRLLAAYPDRFVRVDAPSGPMLEWFLALQERFDLKPYARIERPDRFLMLNRYKSGAKDIYFIVNSSIERAIETRIDFPADVTRKQAWLWDAETGERYLLDALDGGLDLRFGPAEAKLIVFDTKRDGRPLPEPAPRLAIPIELKGEWTVRATHCVENVTKEFRLTELVDLHALPDEWLRNFAGTLEYTQTVCIDDPEWVHTLEAGLTHNGVTELVVNGRSAGVRWWGERSFDVRGLLREGENTLTIRVTTTLADYVESRTDDTPTAKRWQWALRTNKELGLRGPVRLY